MALQPPPPTSQVWESQRPRTWQAWGWPLATLGTVLLLISGLALVVLEREGLLPILPHLYLVSHPIHGTFLARGGVSHPWGSTGMRVRDYVHDVDWIVRRDWDTDGDGSFDCREDSCDHKLSSRWAACVYRRVNGRWVPEPPEVVDCGVPLEHGS